MSGKDIEKELDLLKKRIYTVEQNMVTWIGLLAALLGITIFIFLSWYC
jgi:hypothetical protein